MQFKYCQAALILLCVSSIALANTSQVYQQGLQELKSIEDQVTTIHLNIEEISVKLKKIKSKVSISKVKINKLLAEKNNHLEVLKKQLQNIQILQSEPKFKIFFKPSLYAERVRVNSYYYELRRGHINTLSVLKKNNRSLKQQQHQKSLELDELIKNRTQLKREEQKVTLHYQQHREKVQKLETLLRLEGRNGFKGVSGQEFNVLINRSQKGISSGIVTKVAFSQLKGKIQWPSTGNFQMVRAPYRLAWRVLHQEPKEVRAIADGVVTLVTWIPQLGLVAIVSHGEDYQSIYGNNSVVLVKQGQKIKVQQVLAKTGNTGGRDDVGLFFQLRYKKKPIDFRRWLRS